MIKNIEGEESESYEDFMEPKKKKENNFINNIHGNVHGNIVHLTVNNYIAPDKVEKTEKKKEEKTPVNSRPYSSDQKERDPQKDKKVVNPKKLVYDPNPVIANKSPYDSKIANRISSNSKIPKQKKDEKELNKPNPYERPQSAKHRTAPYKDTSTGVNGSLKKDFLVMNSATNSLGGQKKRYPSNPR